MKGLTVFFDTGEKWRKMLEVFQKSWAQHNNSPLVVVQEEPPEPTSALYGLDTNTRKLELWLEHFTEDTIFCDCDMLVRGDMFEGFEGVENVGYTVRTTNDRPFNAGIFYARHNTYSKKFLKEWLRVNNRMFQDNNLRKEYAKIVPGLNQPALQYLLEHGWSAEEVPEIYNMCDPTRWRDARAVHIKSEARTLCFAKHRKTLRKEYQRTLHLAFWSYLGGSQFMDEPEMVRVRRSGKKVRGDRRIRKRRR